MACLIIESIQVLSFENLILNFELRSSDLDLDHGLDTGPDLELDNSLMVSLSFVWTEINFIFLMVFTVVK